MFGNGSAPGEPAHFLREDPDLVAGFSEPSRRFVQQHVRAPTMVLAAGEWTAGEQLGAGGRSWGDLGFLVLDGLMLRTLDLHGVACAELVGVGDVLRPWADDSPAAPALASEVRWRVVEPARLAVLDHDVAAAIGRWPELVAKLLDRSTQRTHSLAFHLAVCNLPRVETRVLAVLWNLAGRWGRVTADGVALRLPISHRVLGQLVSARRPSVTGAIGRLDERGLVERLPDEGWLLRGEPPQELEQIRRRLAERPDDGEP